MNVVVKDLVPGDMLVDIYLNDRSCGDMWFVIAVKTLASGSMRITFLCRTRIIDHVYDSDVTSRSVTAGYGRVGGRVIVARGSNERV